MANRVCVIFPPNYREFTRPDILIGRVSGHLMENGIAHDVYDMNIGWIRYLLSTDGLTTCKRYCEEQFAKLDQKSELNGMEQKKYEVLLWISSISISDLIDEAKRYVEVFQGKDFYSLDILIDANRFLTNLISAANMILSSDGVPSFFSSSFICNVEEQDGFRQTYYAETISDWNCYQWFVVLVASEAQLLDAFLILHRIKKQNSNAYCILAGHTIGILRDAFIPQLTRDFDFAVTGEVENGISALLMEQKPYSDIPDLLIRMPDGSLLQTDAKQIAVKDRNISFEMIDWSQYLSPVRCVPFSMTFGCCWAKCTFCNLHKSAKYYREYDVTKSVDNLIQLVEKSQSNLFTFTDEALTPSLLDRLSDELLRRQIEIYWTAQLRFSADFNPELFRKIYDAGCRHLEFGLESADEKVQLHMKKGITNQLAKQNLEDAHNVGLITTLNLITGYPCKEDYTKTEQFLTVNSAFIDRVSNFAFYITKGSDLQVNSLEYGIQVNHNLENDLQVTFSDYTTRSGISRQVIEEHVHRIDEYISKQGSRMEASLCPILEYVNYYGTTDTAEIMRRSRLEKKSMYIFVKTDFVSLKNGIISVPLHFNPITIKRRFTKCIAWIDTAKKLAPIRANECTEFLLDTLNQITYPPTESLIWIVKTLKDHPMRFDELAAKYALKFHTTVISAIHYLNSMNMIYRILQYWKAGSAI